MNIKIEKSNNIVLKKDWGKVSDNKEVIENQKEFFGDIKFPSIIIFGARGSGKSTLSILLIREALMTNYTKLVVFSTTIQDDIEGLDSILNYTTIYEKFYKKNENLLVSKYQEAKDRYQKVKDLNDKYVFPNYIFYFDDLAEVDNNTMEVIKDMFVNGRHYGIIPILSQHSYNEFASPIIRNNADILILFGSLEENTITEHIYKIISGTFGIKKKEFKEIYIKATSEDDQTEPPFLLINKPMKEMRKRFNTIIYIQ